MLGYRITPDDLKSVDPELYQRRIVYLRDAVYASKDGIELSILGLVFADDGNDEKVSCADSTLV